MGTQAGLVIPCICPGFKKYYGGKRCVFNEERNKGPDRSGRGREFQMDGATNDIERRPFADRISGTVRRNLSRDGVAPAFALFNWNRVSFSVVYLVLR